MQKATIGIFRGIRRIAFGHWSHTVTGLTIERDRDAGDTVEITYEVPEEKALSTQPELGSGCDLLDTVTLAKTNITPGTGGMAAVKLTYTTPDEAEEDDEDSGSDGSGDSGSGSGSGSSGEDEEKLKKFKSTLDVSVVDEPILTHPKCSGIPDDQLEYLKALIDGARMWEFVPQVKKNGEPLLDKDGQPVRKQLAKLIKGNDTLVRLIRQGVTSYKSMVATYTCSYESGNGKVDPQDVVKIDSPKGAPVLPNRNWMLVNQHASLNDDEKTYTIEKTWMLSGEGGWSNNIYDYTA
ncbi:MAG: hypothetical protein Q4F30_06340 [Akkermansia sp.]|nr:hypothetical protein [Akkermansia sp.]